MTNVATDTGISSGSSKKISTGKRERRFYNIIKSVKMTDMQD